MIRTQDDLPIVGTMPYLRGWWLWVKQGRPRHMPVVIEAGQSVIREDGAMVLTGWTFAFGFMRGTLDLSPGSPDLIRVWEYLVAKGYAKVTWMGVDEWQRTRQHRT